MRIKKHILTLLTITLGLISFQANSTAAPIPGTSSSQFLNVNEGQYISQYGFKISAKNTSWIHTIPSKQSKYILTEYRSPRVYKGIQSALTVRLDAPQHRLSLKNYMKKWLNDYPRFGFKVLGSKPIKVDKQLGFMIDLINYKSKRQIRQVVFLKNKTAVILTCRAHRKNFKKSVTDCNKIIKNFKWMIL